MHFLLSFRRKEDTSITNWRSNHIIIFFDSLYVISSDGRNDKRIFFVMLTQETSHNLNQVLHYKHYAIPPLSE
jgi:hypothetical protein